MGGLVGKVDGKLGEYDEVCFYVWGVGLRLGIGVRVKSMVESDVCLW